MLKRAIGLLNLYLFQFLFVRLFWEESESGQVLGYGVMGPILPLTGWSFTPWGNYYPLPRIYLKWKSRNSNGEI